MTGQPQSDKRSSPSRVGPAPLGFVAVLGCCAVHALIVGGVVATSVAWLGVPAIVIAAGVALWWAGHRR